MKNNLIIYKIFTILVHTCILASNFIGILNFIFMLSLSFSIGSIFSGSIFLLFLLIGEFNTSEVATQPDTFISSDTSSSMTSTSTTLDNQNTKAIKAQNGDTISVHYTGRLENGKLFDTSRESVAREEWTFIQDRPYTPLEFQVWAGKMIPGFDAWVVGMKLGEKKTLTIPPEEGYGTYNEANIQELPREHLTQAGITDPKIGEMIGTAYGPKKILEVGEKTVKIDFNHDLAGKTLLFEVEIMSIQ